MRKLLFFLLVCAISFVSCSKDKDDDNTTPRSEETTEARLEYDITFSNALINKFFNNIKTDGSLPWQAYHDSWDKLTSEENNELGNLFEDNWGLSNYLTRLPLIKNEIFIKDNQVRGVSRGIAHEIQNQWNSDVNKGNYYIGSLISSNNSLGFSYENNILGETGLVVTLDLEELIRTETNETITIDGITGKKVTYTVKQSELHYYEFKSMSVYVSSELSNTINFMHPFSTAETGGVIKAEIEMKNEDFGTIIYELKKVDRRAVTSQEMTNSTPEEVLNPTTDNDFEELYDKIIGITAFIV